MDIPTTGVVVALPIFHAALNPFVLCVRLQPVVFFNNPAMFYYCNPSNTLSLINCRNDVENVASEIDFQNVTIF